MSSEQYMMHQKALLFHDQEIANKILLETDQLTIKKLGREVQNYDNEIWVNTRMQIMRRGLRAKFRQNKEIFNILLSTNDTILAEAAPRDTIWGIGLGSSNPKAQQQELWRGKNLLGKVLMQVRADLNIMVEKNTIDISDIHIDPHHPLYHQPLHQLLENKQIKPIIDCYLETHPQPLDLSIHQIKDNSIGFYQMQYDLQEMITYGLLEGDDYYE